MQAGNKTPTNLSFKKPLMLKSSSTLKSPILTMSLEEKDKIAKAKLLATATKFTRTSTLYKKNSITKEQTTKLNTETKYPKINKVKVTMSIN
jgi:hypothetical protein